ELEAGAERVTVDPRDDRDGQTAERIATTMHQCDELACALPIQRYDLADIGAADKRALAGAGQDHQPQLRVRGEPAGGFDDLGHQRATRPGPLRRLADRPPRETPGFG